MAPAAPTRKRRPPRPTNQPWTEALQQVTGVPSEVAPYHIQALKDTAKFFQDTTTNNPADRYQTSITRWLTAIHQWMRQGGTNSPVPIFHQLVSLLDQPHQRCSATRLMASLLAKSAECRRVWWMDNDARLLQWIDDISRSRDVPFQQESYALLQSLHDYEDWYPAIAVGRLRLQQLCPGSSTSTSSTTTTTLNAATRRHVRDVAMESSEAFCTKMERKLQRANHYLELLVPRVTAGMEEPPKQNDDDDDMSAASDDDDDIAWEDGDEHPTANLAHARAVEATLAAMKHHYLAEGPVEIQLHESVPTTNNESVRRKLQAIVTKLQQHHLPRLALWVNCLTQADALVVSSSDNVLVRMSAADARRRQSTLRRVMRTKQQISSCIAAAQTLHLATTTTTTVPPPPRVPPPSARPTNESLARNLSRKRSRQDHRSNRIQIKFSKHR